MMTYRHIIRKTDYEDGGDFLLRLLVRALCRTIDTEHRSTLGTKDRSTAIHGGMGAEWTLRLQQVLV